MKVFNESLEGNTCGNEYYNIEMVLYFMIQRKTYFDAEHSLLHKRVQPLQEVKCAEKKISFNTKKDSIKKRTEMKLNINDCRLERQNSNLTTQTHTHIHPFFILPALYSTLWYHGGVC